MFGRIVAADTLSGEGAAVGSDGGRSLFHKSDGKLGLISNTVRSDPVFADFVDTLISSRSDVKPNTINAWRQTAEKIRLFFGNRTIRSLTAKDGNDFLRWLNSPVTLGGAGHKASTPGIRSARRQAFRNHLFSTTCDTLKQV